MAETQNAPDEMTAQLDSLFKDLETMSIDALQLLSQKVQDEIKERKNRERQELKRKFEEEAKRLGVTIEMRELKTSDNASNAHKKGRTKTEIKYRNPENPAETWTGRGKRPTWVNRLLEAKGVSPKEVKDLSAHLPELLVHK